MFQKNPANQTLTRDLTSDEKAFSDSLFEIFGAGIHDFALVAEKMQAASVPAPSGDRAPWSRDKLEHELQRVNRLLDESYRGNLPADVVTN
jgi:hypothetical protein